MVECHQERSYDELLVESLWEVSKELQSLECVRGVTVVH